MASDSKVRNSEEFRKELTVLEKEFISNVNLLRKKYGMPPAREHYT